MGSWYIDRSRNVASIFSSEWYAKLVDYAKDKNNVNHFDGKSQEFCSYLDLPTKNPYAILTYLRDLGIIDDSNNATSFFQCGLQANLSPEQFILLILLKRNDNKNGASTVKPFVVLCKAFALMSENGLPLRINWHQCINYLMTVDSYEEITDELVVSMSQDNEDNPANGPDIWFNALLNTGMFTGKSNEITLKDKYVRFISFIAKYGDELKPSENREEYLEQSKDALYGIYFLFKNHMFDAVIAMGDMSGIYDYLLVVKALDEKYGGDLEQLVAQKQDLKLNFTTNIECDYERNRIVFGAPGTGKSFQMEEDRKDILEKFGGGYERVTFHPDYTYSSFVGCYKPISNKGKIEYKYVPGPFMRVLVQALRSGLNDEVAKPYVLVIEEINRAKVAAVFGEVFQLLDRDKNGTSDYEINASEDVKQYLSSELGGSMVSFDKIRIPNNMFIWASMNSADQGVFPMDTAFKRRWSFEYKGIDENEDKVGGDILLGEGEYELKVNWNDLRKAINDVLARTFKINEDKLMGPFFISEEVFAYDETTNLIKDPDKFKKVFKSKVIMYLFEDAAKQYKHKLFSGCDATTYSSICNKFDEIGIDIFGADFRITYFTK